MIILTFGLYGFRFREARLFGDSPHKVLSIRFLFFSATFIRGNPVHDIREAVQGIWSDPEWMKLNAPSLRRAKSRFKAKYRAQSEAMYSEDLTRWRERAENYSAQRGELQNEVYALRRVIDGLQRDLKNATP